MATTILRLPTVCQTTGKSRSTIYLRVKDGLFTKPVAIGPRSIGWPANEIESINLAHIQGKTDAEIRKIVAGLIAARNGAA